MDVPRALLLADMEHGEVGVGLFKYAPIPEMGQEAASSLRHSLQPPYPKIPVFGNLRCGKL